MAESHGSGAERHPIHEYVVLVGDDLVCASCAQRLCGAGESYRRGAAIDDRPLRELGELFAGLEETLDDEMVFRTYNCPGCGRRLDAEICPRAAEPLWDVEIARA